jgi:prefoldin subunit 5
MNNLDQRLERLVERHEAFAQSLELLNSSTQDLRASVEVHDRYLSTLMQAVHQLLEVATNHERRLHHLESES